MEHAQELLPYLMSIIGALVVYVLNGIKAEIKDMKGTVKSLETDLRSGLSQLDRRVSKLEANCDATHGRRLP